MDFEGVPKPTIFEYNRLEQNMILGCIFDANMGSLESKQKQKLIIRVAI